MIPERKNLPWWVRCGLGVGKSANRFVAVTVSTIIVSYLAVVLACACLEGKHGGYSGALAGVSRERPVRDTGEELCNFMKVQMLTLQAPSVSSTPSAKALFLAPAIDETVSNPSSNLDACRPPGFRFVHAKKLDFHSYSVLRI